MNKTYIWGTGKIAEYIYHFYQDWLNSHNIIGFIDNDKTKEGKNFKGKKIFQPTILEDDRDCNILILTASYREIERQIIKNYPWVADRTESYLLFTKFRLLSRYKDTDDTEIADILCYLQTHSLQIFNYDFTEKYSKMNCKIFYDGKVNLFYTLFQNKRMYFARRFDNEEKIRNYYTQIMLEQDPNSPHRYLIDDFQVEKNAIVVDAGVAEGNFALSIIDDVKKIYLFEPDVEWAEALTYTFAPYNDKVVIVNQYLSDFVDEGTVTIDTFVEEEQIDFIKLDIEGEEYYALKGAQRKIAASNHIKCVVCAYHNEFDHIILTQLLQRYGLMTEASKGYMWFPYDRDIIFDLPTLRKGLIRAERK